MSTSRRSVVLGIVSTVVVVGLLAGSVAALKSIWPSGGILSGTVTGVNDFRPVPNTGPMPSTDPALARYYDQKLAWKSCGANQCARMRVPLDYARPDGTEIKIAVLKAPAGDPAHRVGALVVNPGGPGGSGTNFAAAGAAQFGEPLTRYYDIVGFDPRGVGSSDPVRCLSTAQLDTVLAADPDPDTAAERARSDQLYTGFGQGCLARSGELARHISTAEAARDMDILRAALHQPKLDYLGSSYGTFLGAMFANEFPSHVGRFVLDGAIDPALSNEKLSLEQAHGFEIALRSYLADCVASRRCFLGDSVAQGEAKIRALLNRLDSTPLPTGSDRVLTEGLGMTGVFLPLYVKAFWPDLTDALDQAINHHDGAALLKLADFYAARGSNGYQDNSMEALTAVNCLDHDDYIATKDVPAHFAAFEKASPTFGRAFAFGLSTCSNWPIRSGNRTVALHATGAPPIVVIGTTRDPATPYAWAKALADELDSGQLITRNGDGHTGFQRGNSCVDEAVEKWLIEATAPKVDLSC